VNRTLAVAALVLLAGALAAILLGRWPSSRPALDCPPGDVHLDEAGLARCGPGAPLPLGQAHSVGQRADLNRVTADELALLPGISLAFAGELVSQRARLGGFTSWDQVDAIPGVGPARLALLQRECQLGSGDAGVW
jgi:competence protein ComEA